MIEVAGRDVFSRRVGDEQIGGETKIRHEPFAGNAHGGFFPQEVAGGERLSKPQRRCSSASR
jgi:hypothetical protein